MSVLPFSLPTVLLFLTLAYGGPVLNMGSSLNRIPDHFDLTLKKEASAKKLIKCHGHGLQPSKNSCRTFYHCVNLSEHGLHWLAFRFTCPERMFFDSRAKDCLSMDRWDSGHPNCTENSTAEVVTFIPGEKLEEGTALVVNSDLESNSCEHVIEETSLFSTTVTGYKKSVEDLLNEMPQICRYITQANDSFNVVKAKHFLPISPSNTVLFTNISLNYNEELAILQETVDAIMGEEGILKSLNRILLAVKEFESNFKRELLEINTDADGESVNFLPKIIDAEKEELEEVTDHIRTCLNFSSYGYASQAMMTFLVDDLVEYQQHLNDSDIGENDDYGLRSLEGFFTYVNNTSNKIMSDVKELQDKTETSSGVFWNSYMAFGNLRTAAAGALDQLQKERSQLLEEANKTKEEVLKISDELINKESYLLSVREPKHRNSNAWALVTTVLDGWHILTTGKLHNRPSKQQQHKSEEIQNNKAQVVHLKSDLKRMNERMQMLERDLPVREEEIALLPGLEQESKHRVIDSMSFMQELLVMLGNLKRIEDVFAAVIHEAQEDISRARRYHSGPGNTMTRLHLYMAIENLKWNWNNVSRDMHTIDDCGVPK